MEFIEGADRNQTSLLPESIDDFVAEDSPVRVVDAYIDTLDLESLGFERHRPNATGRPMYDPKDLLKLYLYGYMNRIRSSRKLETETKRNLEAMWLLGRLSPDHKTIARFRRDNQAALKNVFRDFVKLCLGLGFFGGELVAVDGSKFRAANSKDRNFTKKKLDDRIGRIESKIAAYIAMLDEADEDDDEERLSAADIKEIIAGLSERREKYSGYRAELEEAKTNQKSLTDPDSRLMMANGRMDVCYNIQTAVDAKHKLIAEFDTTNHPADVNLLGHMTEKAAEILGAKSLTVVADNGYDAASDIALCIRKGHDPHVAGSDIEICLPAGIGEGEVVDSHTGGRAVYIAERNIVLCPMGKPLYPGYYKKSTGKAVFYNQRMCTACSCRCTKQKRYRFEYDMPESEFSTDYDDGNLEVKKVKVHPDRELVRQRKAIVEHPFGTVKRYLHADHCLTKGLGSVNGEFSLLFLAYNLKRVINIAGVKPLLRVLEP